MNYNSPIKRQITLNQPIASGMVFGKPSADISLQSMPDSVYVKFQATPTSNGTNLQLRSSAASGSFDSGGSDYSFTIMEKTEATAIGGGGSTGAAAINFTVAGTSSDTTRSGIRGVIYIDNRLSTSWPTFLWDTVNLDGGGTTTVQRSSGSGTRKNAQATNSISLFFSSGNIILQYKIYSLP